MIRIENLVKTYDRGTKHANEALHDISLLLPDTGLVCILGPSGCGKTSLLNAIGGLDDYDSGKIITDTAEITKPLSVIMERERNANFGYIFQNYYLLSEHSVAYNVYLGMHSLDISHAEKLKRVKDALIRVDMLRYRKRPVAELSGGQQQRVAIARAIARRPKVILADEPTGNLDEANTVSICKTLKELSRESLIIMVTHEERIAKFFADRIIRIESGRLASDDEEWNRGTMDIGEKDAIYAGDYTEESSQSSSLDLRLLTEEGASPVKMTLVVEKDRVVIKLDDPRIIVSSGALGLPKIKEGKRPFATADEISVQNEGSVEKSSIQTAAKRGIPKKMLWREAENFARGKGVRGFAVGVFVILLSFMLSLSVSDIVTTASIDPEDFITSDSHIIDVEMLSKGIYIPGVTERETIKYVDYLRAFAGDVDILPEIKAKISYSNDTVVQFGKLYINFSNCRYADISRVNEKDIIYGRMPRSANEIVIDRWVIDKALERDGILQNTISSPEYFINKTVTVDKTQQSLRIVGICEKGEPTVYVDKITIIGFCVNGARIITLEEYEKAIGGDSGYELLDNECVAIVENAGIAYATMIGDTVNIGPGNYTLTLKEANENFPPSSVSAKFIVNEKTAEMIYNTVINYSDNISVYCADKEFSLPTISNISEEIENKLYVTLIDKYQEQYDEYKESTDVKFDAKIIVTVTVLIVSVIMLYLMQRSKIKERMDILAVYRLLGIPKGDLVFVFSSEALITTVKFALPTVFISWLGIRALSKVELIDKILIYPLWAAGATLLFIGVVRVLIAALPILRLLAMPPAKLASKHDF